MKYRELYLRARETLRGAGVPEQDAVLLAEEFLGLSRAGLAVRGDETAGAGEEAAFLEAVEQRRARRPMQYILGRWEFMGLSLAVSEGVLCPREDTAVAVNGLAERLAGQEAPVGVDLCAGSGAVGLGLCSLIPGARVCCVELSDRAFKCLEKNIAAYPMYGAEAVRGDILLPDTAAAFKGLDFIAANPPYVRTGEIAGLEPEVANEPFMALDGGEDGLKFYRAIAEIWIDCLRPGGALAVEIGEDQAGETAALFAARGIEDIKVLRDFAGLDRAVTGIKRA